MSSSLLHPNYYPEALFNDVALLGLSAPADLARLPGGGGRRRGVNDLPLSSPTNFFTAVPNAQKDICTVSVF